MLHRSWPAWRRAAPFSPWPWPARSRSPPPPGHAPGPFGTKKPLAVRHPAGYKGRKAGGGLTLSSWTPQRVLDAAAATEFVPEGAVEVRTGDYRLLPPPDRAPGPARGPAPGPLSPTAPPPHD